MNVIWIEGPSLRLQRCQCLKVSWRVQWQNISY